MAKANKLISFISLLEEEVKNHSIYVWGAQGQDHKIITEAWIKKCETSTNNANRAIKYWNKQKASGFGKVLKAFDCSGLGVWALQTLGIISTDLNANGLKGKCTLIQKNHLKKGDWVFRVYTSGSKKGRAYHIGYVVDDNLNVIESYGRDKGVIKRSIDASGKTYWNTFGRPSYFINEIDSKKEQTEHASFNRILKKGMKGDDVRELQKLLNAAGDNITVDGSFGSKTLAAVKDFQKRKGLTVDGIVGEKTIAALTGAQKTNAQKVKNTWEVSRILKKGCEGGDVKELQRRLIEAGHSCGSKGADGDFGSGTEKAVRAFQKVKKLTIDGVVGKNTVTALGGKWVNK